MCTPYGVHARVPAYVFVFTSILLKSPPRLENEFMVSSSLAVADELNDRGAPIATVVCMELHSSSHGCYRIRYLASCHDKNAINRCT